MDNIRRSVGEFSHRAGVALSEHTRWTRFCRRVAWWGWLCVLVGIGSVGLLLKLNESVPRGGGQRRPQEGDLLAANRNSDGKSAILPRVHRAEISTRSAPGGRMSSAEDAHDRLSQPLIESFGLSDAQLAESRKIISTFHERLQDEMARRMCADPRFDVPSKYTFGFSIKGDKLLAEALRDHLENDLAKIGGETFAHRMVDHLSAQTKYLTFGEADITIRVIGNEPEAGGNDERQISLIFQDSVTGKVSSSYKSSLRKFNEIHANLFDLETIDKGK